MAIARIDAALGQSSEAFEWLQKACNEQDSAVIWLNIDPTMDNLRFEPQFAQMLKDMAHQLTDRNRRSCRNSLPTSAEDNPIHVGGMSGISSPAHHLQ